MAWSMRWGYFFRGWGFFVQAISLSVLSLATGLGISIYPLREHGDLHEPALDETSAPPELETYAS